jgi:HD superfamily phosphohydrolase
MDRLDYLRRDSFFTGVSEGVIGSERIIKMLNVMDDQLVVEIKGIYSIEKFLIARRLMYWQVYLHKTVLAAEKMLETTLQRAKDMLKEGAKLEASDALLWFLKNENYSDADEVLERFSLLDDSDVMASIKSWTKHPDKILSHLANGLMNRKLFRVYLQKEAFKTSEIDEFKTKVKHYFNITENDLKYFVFSESIVNTTYSDMNEKINILKRGELTDISDASDMLSPAALNHDVIKYYICYPKEIEKR